MNGKARLGLVNLRELAAILAWATRSPSPLHAFHARRLDPPAAHVPSPGPNSPTRRLQYPVRCQHHRRDWTAPWERVAHGTLLHHACPQARRERAGDGRACRGTEHTEAAAQHVAVCQPRPIHCYIWRRGQDRQRLRYGGMHILRRAILFIRRLNL